MSISIKVSELNVLPVITGDDYIVLNDSGSLTTRRATINVLGDFLSGSTKPVLSSSYSTLSLTSSYAISCSYSSRTTTSSYSISSSYSDRSFYSTYVTPSVNLPANTVNLTGTSSYSLTASYLPQTLYSITSSNSQTASYLEYSGNYNGSSSYALSASICDVALNVIGGGGISGTSVQNFLTKWSATGANQPLYTSSIFSNGAVTVFRDETVIYEEPISAYASNVALADFNRTAYNASFVFAGGNVVLTGSATSTRRGMSNKLFFTHPDTTDAVSIHFSSSLVGGIWDSGAMILETYDDDTQPFIFRTYQYSDGSERDHLIIRPIGDDTWIDISGSLFAHDYIGVGNLMSRTGVGARLHVSGSSSDTIPLLVTSATNPTTHVNYVGLYATAGGQVGIGVTQPQTRLETIGSFSSPEYYVKSGSDYLKGISGTWIVFDLSDPNGATLRKYLTFSNGILVNSSAAPALPNQTVTAPLSAPSTSTTTPPSGGGGSGCPAIWQEIETLELGFVPAEKVEKGMHVRDIDGWNLVYNAFTDEADIWRVVILDETFDVDVSHLWMVDKNVWKRVTDLQPFDVVYTSNGTYATISDVKFLKKGKFRHLNVDRKRYVLGKSKIIGHNAPGTHTVIKG